MLFDSQIYGAIGFGRNDLADECFSRHGAKPEIGHHQQNQQDPHDYSSYLQQLPYQWFNGHIVRYVFFISYRWQQMIRTVDIRTDTLNG